ncbi:hypothetical protein N0V84_005976 [Fusarium piperis]|uniref:Uncharacterized protein n=1 Tax=Fusarium piperis TaxID=1435070 RepID=A0A9W9BNN9_9HYPO|nr:hypothetical protein N0V84_005976 [Fusarium piperis]
MSENFTSQTLTSFDPPGFPVQDDKLTDKQKQQWSDTVSFWMDQEINAGYTDDQGVFQPLQAGKQGAEFNRTPLTQFFNGRVTPFDVSQEATSIEWKGFPRLVEIAHKSDKHRWADADANRDRHDEYLEWTVKKDEHGHIVSVTFTCEGPEYWDFLATHDKDKLLSIYKACNPEYADQIKLDDMFDSDGKYNPYNPWNGIKNLKDPAGKDPSKGFVTTNPGCIMHLAQANNTLGAEVDIAAQATVVREDSDGNQITDKTKLCNCSKYGQPKRHSDPEIGVKINGLASDGNRVSIANPVGIYMNSFDSNSFKLDDGSGVNKPVPAGTFTWVRGDIRKNMGLRLHIEVPKSTMGTGTKEGQQLTVHDIVDEKKRKIEYGGQFADHIQMCVNGVTISGDEPAPAQLCPCGKPPSDGDSRVAMMKASAPGTHHGLPLIKTRY